LVYFEAARPFASAFTIIMVKGGGSQYTAEKRQNDCIFSRNVVQESACVVEGWWFEHRVRRKALRAVVLLIFL
jgi:hypothetical protein